ncbi:MAG: hypothetical protein AAFZ15_08935 [Bacteroidota bacterium]
MKNQILNTLLFLSFLTLFSCDTKKAADTTTPDNPSFIKNEIIVQLKKDVAPRELTAAHEKYELTMKEAVSKITNMWLFTYNTDLIDPEKMLKKLKESALTVNAEFNKKLTGRD